MGVFLSYVTARGHALIDREVYLPEDWCADLPRQQAAHIPDHVPFATKPELAQRMVQRAQAAQLPIGWIVADTVYGHAPELRRWLEEQGYAYVLAVPSTEAVCVQTRTGLLCCCAMSAPSHSRHYALVIGTAFRKAWGPKVNASLTGLACQLFTQATSMVVIGSWCVAALTIPTLWPISWFGLPQYLPVHHGSSHWCQMAHRRGPPRLQSPRTGYYEGRRYLGWYRHSTLVLLASAFLLAIIIQHHLSAAAHLAQAQSDTALIPLTTSEARHMLTRLFFPLPTSALLISQWSWFRRTHQYWAGYYHRRRREKAS